MKQFKKAMLSLVLIVCAVFLCACGGGGNPPATAQIDTPATVNTSGTYTESSKAELDPYLTSTNPAYVGNFATSYKMSQKMTVNNTPVMTANYIFKVTDGMVTEMARKASMSMSMGGATLTYNSMEYLKNNTYYAEEGENKYYLDSTNENWNTVIGSELEFSFDLVINENLGYMLENAGLTVTKAVEGTTTKFKAVATTAVTDDYDEDADGNTDEVLYNQTETFVLVIENGNFAGLHYAITDDVSTDKTEINMVPFTEDIDFPSAFTGYVAYDPEIHGSSIGE